LYTTYFKKYLCLFVSLPSQNKTRHSTQRILLKEILQKKKTQRILLKEFTFTFI